MITICQINYCNQKTRQVVQKPTVYNNNYLHTDYLGSILSVTDESGAVIYKQSFDAWGRERNADDWTYNPFTTYTKPEWLIRGFTGHEHLPEFNLINMNGRLYDPVIGRMLSPDNYSQGMYNTQGYNRYSYALNNPLKYTDPSGEYVQFIIGAVIGGFTGYIVGRQAGATGGKLWAYIGIGAAAGALSGGIGGGVNSALAGGSFGAGFVGTSTVAATGFAAGAVTGGAVGVTNGLITGTGYGWLGGQSFGDAFFNQGLDQAWKQGLSGAAIGGVLGGIDATRRSRDFWTGDGNTGQEELVSTIEGKITRGRSASDYNNDPNFNSTNWSRVDVQTNPNASTSQNPDGTWNVQVDKIPNKYSSVNNVANNNGGRRIPGSENYSRGLLGKGTYSANFTQRPTQIGLMGTYNYNASRFIGIANTSGFWYSSVSLTGILNIY